MKLYNVTFKDNEDKTRYISATSVQTCSSKIDGVMTLERAQEYVEYVDNAEIVEYPEKIDGQLATVKSWDGQNIDAIVIKRTARYIWIAQFNDKKEVALTTLQKHKLEHEGTYTFRTNIGFKLN